MLLSLARRKKPLLAAFSLTCLLLPMGAQAAAQSALDTSAGQLVYSGFAYGSEVKVASTVTSGRSAPVTHGCTSTAGLHKTNTVAEVKHPPMLDIGTVSTTADTFADPTKSQTSASVQAVNLLAGVVTATAVQAQSATSHVDGAFALSDAGTTFTGLKVLGLPVNLTVAPNTKITLPNYGYVVLNQQNRKTGASSASLAVTGIRVVITATNALGIAPGTTLTVAHASSTLEGPVAGPLGGTSYGTSVKVGTTLQSGPSFAINMPCLGTNGVLRANTGAGVNVSGILSSSGVRNTLQGTVDATRAVGQVTSSVDSANLLNGLVEATMINAVANAAKDGTTPSFTDTGSTFGTLRVTGFPQIGPEVAPNTKLAISGVGTLYLHRVIRTAGRIEVRMIELVGTDKNHALVGTNIRVGVAWASVR